MSSYPQNSRRRRGGTGVSSSGSRTVLGYWVPLALTVGIATVSIAAWIWSERNDDEDDEDDSDYGRDDDRRDDGHPPAAGPGREYAQMRAPEFGESHQEDESMMARMHGALRRTPSPQQIFDGASRRVAASVAAAGALVGGALTSIREEDRGDFEDHSRWSEEVRSRATQQGVPSASVAEAMTSRAAAVAPPAFERRKRIVAIVVSSETLHPDQEDLGGEHAVSVPLSYEHINLPVRLADGGDAVHSFSPYRTY